MRVILAAGGTAGHINPALAIADKFVEVFPDTEILFIGTADGMEADLVKKANYKFMSIKAERLRRKVTIKNMALNAKALAYFITAQNQVKKIIKDFKPDFVIGTGGYVSAPVLNEAVKLGIKTATHESNSLPGVATKMLAKKVDKVFVASEDTKARLDNISNCVVTGNPLRTMPKNIDRQTARKELKLSDGITILSYGGSLGANKISESVAGLMKWEQEKANINHIHAYGGNGRDVFYSMLDKSGVDKNSDRLILKEYIHNMYTCICAADLIICRAGAMTITELTFLGRASVLIPFPEAAENHQYYNALTLEKAKAAYLIEDKDLNKEKLIEIVENLYNNKEAICEMEKNAKMLSVPDSAGKILSELLELKDRKQ